MLQALMENQTMLLAAVVVIMLACGYSQYRNGLFSSVAMLISVVVSGLVAFGFWEPLADLLDLPLQNSAPRTCS
ncbi:MAG: hypothetical protein HY289_02155 [Planctomycetes bacterium]|nr:hypothetical protein [Planctomycetota bacterium]